MCAPEPAVSPKHSIRLTLGRSDSGMVYRRIRSFQSWFERAGTILPINCYPTPPVIVLCRGDLRYRWSPDM